MLAVICPADQLTIGDFSTTRVEGASSLVHLVFNTIMNLRRQAEQVACFRNAAAHLEPGGCFLVEVGVPQLRRLPPGQTTLLWAQGPTAWAYDADDTASQSLVGRHEPFTHESEQHVSVWERVAVT